MISTSPLTPSLPTTLGELRRLTAQLPDETPLAIEDMPGAFPAPAVWLEHGSPAPSLIFAEPTAP